MEIQDKISSEALLLKNMETQLNRDVLTEIFDFLPFKLKRCLNKELYIMGWKDMIIRRQKQFSPQTFYNYYKFIINNSNKHRCVFILDLIMKKRDFYMPYPRCICICRKYTRNTSTSYTNCGKPKDFYERYTEISSTTNSRHEKILFFSNLLYDEKLEFDHLFETKIWPEMKDILGSLIKDRYKIERATEYSRWSSYHNKLDYLNSKSWLK
jgi:hypothetical protein